MEMVMDVVLHAGRNTIELCLFVLLPVMVFMLAIMRLLESWGVLDFIVDRLAPVLRPMGLTGLGVFAALQITFVSFAAPVATLALMESRGTSNRHLAATLAMVFAMAQANVVFPMLSMELHLIPVLLWSLVGGLAAAAVTYWGFGRNLSSAERLEEEDDRPNRSKPAEGPKGNLDAVNQAGADAFRISVGAIPMLLISMVVVALLQRLGAIDWITHVVSPFLAVFSIDQAYVLPTITKYLAGGTAMMGIADEMLRQGAITGTLLNQGAGFLTHPLDVPGVAVLISAGRRVTAVWRHAAAGAVVGIIIRTIGNAWLW
ncbi:MAG: nucleoside recognition domain-containing protein [Rhodospirillaceae bacterium]|nr:nucleoside recognition domain-containing protein [Rhodospirillaceae bacterium]